MRAELTYAGRLQRGRSRPWIWSFACTALAHNRSTNLAAAQQLSLERPCTEIKLALTDTTLSPKRFFEISLEEYLRLAGPIWPLRMQKLSARLPCNGLNGVRSVNDQSGVEAAGSGPLLSSSIDSGAWRSCTKNRHTNVIIAQIMHNRELLPTDEFSASVFWLTYVTFVDNNKVQISLSQYYQQ